MNDFNKRIPKIQICLKNIKELLNYCHKEFLVIDVNNQDENSN